MKNAFYFRRVLNTDSSFSTTSESAGIPRVLQKLNQFHWLPDDICVNKWCDNAVPDVAFSSTTRAGHVCGIRNYSSRRHGTLLSFCRGPRGLREIQRTYWNIYVFFGVSPSPRWQWYNAGVYSQFTSPECRFLKCRPLIGRVRYDRRNNLKIVNGTFIWIQRCRSVQRHTVTAASKITDS